MKTNIIKLIILGITLLSSLPLYANNDTICIKKDCVAKLLSDSTDTMKMYKYSTIKASLVVRIENVDTNAKGYDKEKNKKGKFAKGVVFAVKKDSSQPKEVQYTDSAGVDRSNVTGVNFKKYYLKMQDGKEYLLNYDDVEKVKAKPLPNDLDYLFQYDSKNNKLSFAPNVRHIFPKLKVVNNGQTIHMPSDSVYNGDLIRVIFSPEGSYYLDSCLKVSSIETNKLIKIDSVSDSTPGISRLDDFLRIFPPIVLIITGLLIIIVVSIPVIIFVSLRRNTEKVKKCEDKVSKLIEKIEHPSESTGTIEITKEIEAIGVLVESKIEEMVKGKDVRISELKNEINTKKKEVEKIKNDNKLDSNTIIIENSEDFVKKAEKILKVCREGENVIKEFIENLPDKKEERMSFFLSKYIVDINNSLEERDRWIGHLATLKLNGSKGYYTVDPNFSGIKSENNKLDVLKERFVKECLQKYLSPIIIMLDQIRCAKQYGIDSEKQIDGDRIIKTIISANKDLGVTVGYIPLFEKISKDEKNLKEGLVSNPPEWLKEIITKKDSNVPIHLIRIGVNDGNAENQKTEYI